MGTKSIVQSVTFWGSITALLAMFMPKLFAALGQDPSTVAQYIVGAVGFVITVYGRLKATQVVTVTGAPPAAGKPPLPPAKLQG